MLAESCQIEVLGSNKQVGLAREHGEDKSLSVSNASRIDFIQNDEDEPVQVKGSPLKVLPAHKYQ